MIYCDDKPGSHQGLRCVATKHQSLQSVSGATALTYYRDIGIESAQRKAFYEQPWAYWRDTVLAELSVPHPYLPEKATRLEVMR